MTPTKIIAELARRFPTTIFADRWAPHRPLKLKIHLDIQERWPELNQKLLSRALRQYCTRRQYHNGVLASANRFDLDGNPAGEITEADRENARQYLKTLDARVEAQFEQAKEAHRAKKKAARQARREAEFEAGFKAFHERLDAHNRRREQRWTEALAAYRQKEAARRTEQKQPPVKSAPPPPPPKTTRMAVLSLSRRELAERAKARRAASN